MMKNPIIYLLLLSVVSCFSQKYYPVKFDTVSRKTSAKELFLRKIIEKDESMYEDEGKRYSAVQIFQKFNQTANAVQYDLKVKNNNRVEVIGKLYGIERYVDSDTIFEYENLSFNRFSIFSDTKGKTVAYKLYNDNLDEAEVNRFLEKYKQFSKNPTRESDSVFEFDDKTIILKKSINNEVSPVSVGDISPVSEGNLSVSTESPEKENQTSFVSVEFTVIFKGLTLDLKNYLEKNLK